jgi:hypothetical protein
MTQALTVGRLFGEHFDDYHRRYPQPAFKRKVIKDLIGCRTAQMGGHRQCCPNGDYERVHYNSCKNRNCPLCSALPTERWLDQQRHKLLGCDHYHAVFTVPHYLLALWWTNNRLMADLLFRCAVATLRQLLEDPKYLGASVGVIAALHTWGRDLYRHPHWHLLITGGGWTGAGDWKSVEGDFLLPYRVVRQVFRAKYVEALKQAYEVGRLRLPNGVQSNDFQVLMHKVRTRVKWRTHFCEPYRHGHGVLTYLARYVKGGAFKNSQLLSDDGERITFRYQDHRTATEQTARLSYDEWMRRVLWHIPEKGQHRIRYYGLYHAHKKEQRQACRRELAQTPEPEGPSELLRWQEFLTRLGLAQHTTCPICGAKLIPVALERSTNQQAPPLADAA